MNKVVIITGSSGLLGRHFVERLKKKYKIISIDLGDNEFSTEKNVIHLKGDITKISVWNEVSNLILRNKAFISGLINNAAITNATRSGFKNHVDAFKDTLDVNVVSQYLSIEVLKEQMIEQGFGRIINIGSLYSKIAPTPRLYEDSKVLQTPGYTVSKHAVIGLTRFYASQLIKHKITVNAVSPGGIFDFQDESFLAKYQEQNPSGRMGSPEDIFPIIEGLINESNNYLTGQNILVDGGWTSI
ncbi:SDR family oxidoreductase [Akkermansiaceae bacterium]|nr:SDR family oxidoreductase [Akkermansiaceae bacterium]